MQLELKQSIQDQLKTLSGVKTKLEIFTPAQAQKELDITAKKIESGEFRQRNIRDRYVNKLANDSRAGKWLASPQTVAFNVDGMIIDGRHRLSAIVKSGVPAILNVSRGWPSTTGDGMNTIDVIDQGCMRNVGQQLAIGHNKENGKILATTARAIAMLCCESHNPNLTVYQTLRIVEIYERSIETIYAMTTNMSNRRAYFYAPIAFLHASNPDDALRFAKRVFSLDDLTANSPEKALLKYQADHTKCHGGGDKLKLSQVVVAAMYHAQFGRKVKNLMPSSQSTDWLFSLQPKNYREVQQISCQENSNLA